MRKYFKPIILSLSLTLLCFMSAGCTSGNVKKAFDHLKNGNYSDAVSLYQSDVENDSEKKDELKKLVEEYVDECKEKFDKNELSYTDFTDILETSERMGADTSKINKIFEYARNINDSRTAYETAEKFFAANDYVNAVKYYGNVIVDDSNYADSVEKKKECTKKIRDDAIANAEKFAGDDDYLKAIQVIETALKIIPDDYDLTSRKTFYENENKKILIAACEQNADKLVTAGKLEEALDVLRDGASKYPDSGLKERRDEVYALLINSFIEKADGFVAEDKYAEALNSLKKSKNDYRDALLESRYDEIYSEFLDKTIAAAGAAFDSDGHKAALAVLREQMGWFEGNTEYENKLSYYIGLEPVYLTSYEVFDAKGRLDSKGSCEDAYGNYYTNCLSGYSGLFGSASSGDWNQYYINSNFASVSGFLAPIFSDIETCRMKIYGDDVLLYTSPNIEYKTDPIEFNVNIKGVRYLKIEVECMGVEWGDVHIVIGDILLNKY